jgi:hypothetical protein
LVTACKLAANSMKPVDSFCSAGNGRGQNEIGLARGLLWPGAALEQWSNICCNEDSTLQGYMALGRSEKSERPIFLALC